MIKQKIVILGAGLSGLSAAWHLKKRGKEPLVFEKEKEPGGLCRSKKISGFIFDYDGHLLHFKHPYVFGLIKSLLGNNLAGHNRSSWVYSYGKYTPYPFQANLHGMPSPVIKDCLLGFIDAAKRGGHPSKKQINFLDWINRTFGEGIASHFMVPYNTKFWTLPPKELTCEWLDGFIPVPSLNRLVEGAFGGKSEPLGYNTRFWYPKQGGISQVPLALASQMRNIHASCQAIAINLKKKEIKFKSGGKEKFDYLVYTLPLPEIPALINGLPETVNRWFKNLKWNSIFNLNLGMEDADSSKKHWAYFPQDDLSFFRVGFPHNFSSSLTPAGKGSLYAEVAYSREKPVDKNSIISRIKKDLKETGILDPNARILAQDSNDIKYGYPIYDRNYKGCLENIIQYLHKHNIIPCGRYGSWRYLSMEGSILDGKRAAELFLKNA